MSLLRRRHVVGGFAAEWFPSTSKPEFTLTGSAQCNKSRTPSQETILPKNSKLDRQTWAKQLYLNPPKTPPIVLIILWPLAYIFEESFVAPLRKRLAILSVSGRCRWRSPLELVCFGAMDCSRWSGTSWASLERCGALGRCNSSLCGNSDFKPLTHYISVCLINNQLYSRMQQHSNTRRNWRTGSQRGEVPLHLARGPS